MKKKKINIIISVLIFVILDQIVKWIIAKYINNEFIIVKNLLKFNYVKNTGAAFSIFSGSQLFLIIITILIISYLIFELKKSKNNVNIFALILILSGAVGNLIDRIFLGYVRDFISFTIFSKDFAIFNIADSYITIGVVLYIYCVLRDEKNERNNSK